MSAEQVRGLNERFLEMMRKAAFADQDLTAGELAELKRAAGALAVPGYFDDLQPRVGKCQQQRTPRSVGADIAERLATTVLGVLR
jgi:DNA polymerase-3 subunit epsilon